MTDNSQASDGATPPATSAPPIVSDADRAETWYPKETAADAEKAAAEQAAKDPAAAEAAAAEAPYQFAPIDGFEIDQDMAKEATPVLRGLGIDDAGANRLAPLAAKVVSRAFERQHHEFLEVKNGWAKEAKADPDIGAGNWPQTERLLARTLDAADAAKGSEFRKLLNESGLGNHPVFIRAFRNIGRKLGGSGSTPTSPRSREEIWYPQR